jgi:hypothetical protein
MDLFSYDKYLGRALKTRPCPCTSKAEQVKPETFSWFLKNFPIGQFKD